MTPTDEIDAQLRAMLHARSQDIQSLPADLLPSDAAAEADAIDHSIDRRRDGRSHRTLLIAASVAAVLAVSGGVTALALNHGGSTKTASTALPTAPSTSPSSETRSTPNTTPTSTATCSTTLPAQWRTAVTSSPTPDGTNEAPLAVSPDGDALVSRDTGSSRSVVLHKADGSTKTLLTLPDSSDLAPAYGFLDNYAVVGLTRSPGGSNGAGNPLMRIEAIDPSSGKVLKNLQVATEADYESAKRTVDTMAVQDGVIYWDERNPYGAKNGVVRSFDLSDGARKVVHRGRSVHLGTSAGGVYWAPWSGGTFDNVIHAPNPDVPQPVMAATTPAARVTLSTDGTHWVWSDAAGKRIGYFDGTKVSYLTGKALELVQRPVVAVSGPYVLLPDYGQQRTRVVDTRTGAVVTLPEFTVLFQGGSSVAVGSLSSMKLTGRLLEIDTAKLPGLSC